jgi:hypothetical protein
LPNVLLDDFASDADFPVEMHRAAHEIAIHHEHVEKLIWQDLYKKREIQLQFQRRFASVIVSVPDNRLQFGGDNF